MQNQNLFPHCLCCGERLEAKHRILDGLFQCPKCKNEHYFTMDYQPDMIAHLLTADQLRNSHLYDEAFKQYESLSKKYPQLVNAFWGMFLSTYGIVYIKDQKSPRYIPAIHTFYDESPLKNKYYLKTLDLSKDSYMKKIFIKECEFITSMWESASSTIKKVKTAVVKDETVVQTKPVEIEPPIQLPEKKVGQNLNEAYKSDPLVENKINSAEQIYLQGKKFSRAIKVFDEIIKTDPYAVKARWNKILATLEVTTFDDVNPKVKLDSVYQMFEEMMGFIKPNQENTYLQAFESHLLRKLIETSEFDQSLYNFILAWKKAGEKQLFADLIYQEIIKKIKQANLTTVEWIHQALESLTQGISKKDQRVVKKYVDLAEHINPLGFHKDALLLAQTVLKEYPNHIQANRISICAFYQVKKLEELRYVIKDLKFVDFMNPLLIVSHKPMDIFAEVKFAILSLIDQKSYKLSQQMISKYISLLPKDEVSTLQESLLDFTKYLIYHYQFKEAEKHVNHLLEIDDKLAAAYWAKFMITLRAHTHFEVLMLTKHKDLMKYPDFDKAMNSTSQNKAYIQFYEIQDSLKEPTPDNNMFKKIAHRKFQHFDDMCKYESLGHFVSDIYPQIKKEIPTLFHDEQKAMMNIINRSVIVTILVLFSFIMSHMRLLFDASNTSDPLIVADFVLNFVNDLVLIIFVPALMILYISISIREQETVSKGVLKGFLLGLIFSILSLGLLGLIPWLSARYLTTTLFNLSPYIVPSVVFGITLVSNFFILRLQHKKLVKAKVSPSFLKVSFRNVLILSIVSVSVFLATFLILIL